MILAYFIGFVEVKFVDILDVMFVTVLLYQVYKLMRGSVAIRVFLGFLSLYLLFLVVKAANMELLTSILGQFMGVGVLAVIILFQQEIRKFLLLLGRTPVFSEGSLLQSIRFWATAHAATRTEVTPIVEAAKTLGGTNTGALMVFSKNSELKFYADSGDRLDAMLSKRLILSIFNKYSPLHDGAVIIREGRIVAARCILPVTERDDIPANFGLRHRAAIGMSEVTDVFIIIVSEETGQISTVTNGKIFANQSTKELRAAINDYLLEEKPNQAASVLEQVKKEEVTQQAS